MSMRLAVPVALLSILVSAGSVLAQSRLVPVTYRDFHGLFTDNDALAHPDFENEDFFLDACGDLFCNGLLSARTGMVATSLGMDGTPVLGNGELVTSAASFFEWFHDNQAGSAAPNPRMTKLNRSLLLEQQPDGSYVFDSNDYGGFFPIDGQGFGNTPRGPFSRTPPYNPFTGQRAGPDIVTGHNFHFTTHVSILFEFDPAAGHVFTFRGDDDFWLFINGKLVVDLGGIHQAVESAPLAIGNELADVDGHLLNLVAGNLYTFDVFHAERHRNGSNFRFETNLPLGEQVILGDMNGDGVLDAFDVAPFELALADQAAYLAAFPLLDPNILGDFDASLVLDAFDVNPFEQALAGASAPLPEPATTTLALLTLLTLRRRRSSRN